MKKCYLTPAVTIVKMQSMSIICSSGEYYCDSVSSNVDLHGGGANGSIIGSFNSARSRESNGIWDEEW